MSALSEQVLRELSPDAPLYFVLDGARDRSIRRWILGSGAPAWCLYAGALPAELEDAAPWLVRVLRGHAYAERLFELGWSHHWGIALASQTPAKLLRRHLRRFLVAQTEDRRKLVFRYYDPRVLRAYLPTCNAEELASFFGPISAFATNDSEPSSLNLFRRAGEALEQRRIAIPAAAPAAGFRESW